MLHPFSPDGVIFGLLPQTLAGGPDQLFAVLKRLFEKNGSEDQPLLLGLPTCVGAPIEGSPLSSAQMKELFRIAAGLGGDEEPLV